MDTEALENPLETPHNEHSAQQQPSIATSRICVKNLPKHVDEKRLREHFSAKGEVTDAKIVRTKDGKSRLFGFVGFRTAEDAAAAVKYFNKSFLDASRLAVEFAYKYGNTEAPRAWSKYTSGTSANKKAAQEGSGANTVPLGDSVEGGDKGEGKTRKKKGKEHKPEEADPKLAEFMQLMQPRSHAAIWSNEDALLQSAGGRAAAATAAGQQGTAGAPLEDGERSEEEEEYQELPEEGRSGSDSEDAGDSEAQADADAVVKDAGVSDMDYLRSRMRSNFDEEDAEQPVESGSGGSDSEGHVGSESEPESEPDSVEEDAAKNAGPGPGSRKQEQGEQQLETLTQQHHKQQRGQLKTLKLADEAEDELDAVFGGDRGKGREKGEDEEEDEEGGGGEGEQDLDADAMEEDGGESQGEEGVSERERDVEGAAVAIAAGGDGEASIGDTGRLFVRNLPYTAGEADLRQLFEQFGEVAEAHLVLDRLTKKSKGFALIQFASPDDAVRAHSELDGSIFMGRLLHILPGKRLPPPPQAEGEEGEAGEGKKKGGFKEQNEAKLKASAGNRAAWNTLFMRSDTVAEAIATHYGVSKAELLDREAADMAVRMALGETYVIAETKRQLGEAGASLEMLEAAASVSGKASQHKSVARSDSVLLVKNLPYTASVEELDALFGAVGPLGRLVLPSTKTLALVEYLEPQDARRAFKALAYKRYQHVPLYLEWAPKGIFSSPPPPPGQRAKPAVESGKVAKGKAGSEAAAATTLAGADDADSDSCTIFVKNLAWATEDSALRKHFEATAMATGGKLRAAKVAKRKGPDGKMLSAGYGFVECSTEDVSKEVIKKLQGSTLDGHKLALQLSTHNTAAAAGGEAGQGAGKQRSRKEALPDTTKMVVRNVAFEATRKDIMGLFAPFGHVKSCRLPRKFDGTHRGFAFVDFATKQEARNAMEAVAGAHLYGRRLVLEWAEEEGGLDELRAKTAAKYRGDDVGDVADQDGGGLGLLPVAEDRPSKKQKRT